MAQEEKKIRNSILNHLKKNGMNDAYHRDIVDEYMEARIRLAEAKVELCELHEFAEQEDIMNASQTVQFEIANMSRLLDMIGASNQSQRRIAIEKDLRTQMAKKGLSGAVFDDKADQFMKMWDAYQEANRSLVERGRNYITISSAGKNYEKDNSATRDIVSMEKAMRDIMASLEITVKDFDGLDDDEL